MTRRRRITEASAGCRVQMGRTWNADVLGEDPERAQEGGKTNGDAMLHQQVEGDECN